MKDTKDRLVTSALSLFSRSWYEKVSIAEICRNAGLSNGVFYRYFKNKEEIFKELLEIFLSLFKRDLERVSGGTVASRLENFIDIVIGAGKRYRAEVTVFREGQYRFPIYENRLRNLYIETVRRVYDRDITEEEYLFLVSGIRFLSTRSLYNNLKFDKEFVRTSILTGLFSDSVRNDLFGSKIDTTLLLEETPVTTRDRILEAGMKLFGKEGFFPVSIYEIIREAGLSVGTFYLHFPGKDDFLSQIIGVIGSRTRRFIREHLSSGINRLEMELQGMWYFLTYFDAHNEYYEIVREAEFVVKESVGEYYNKFQHGYLKNLPFPSEQHRLTAANFLMGISHYFGIELIFGKNIPDRKSVILTLGEFLSRGIPE